MLSSVPSRAFWSVPSEVHHCRRFRTHELQVDRRLSQLDDRTFHLILMYREDLMLFFVRACRFND